MGGDEGPWRPEGLSSAIKTTKPRTVTTLSLPVASEEVPFECVLRTSEEYQDLSVRALNCLKAADVDTVGDLVKLNRNDLLKFRNFGKKSLTELDELLTSLNLKFGMDVSIYKLDKD